MANMAQNVALVQVWTPLHQAVFECKVDCAKCLLAHGADTHARGNGVRSPCLHNL